MLPAKHFLYGSSSNEICKVSYTPCEQHVWTRLTNLPGSSNKIWCQNGGRNTSITRSDLIWSVILHLFGLTANVDRLGRKRSKPSHGLSKASIILPERLDVNCPQTSSITPFNRPSVIMPLYIPHPHKQAQSIVCQLSRPMAPRRTHYKADQHRHKLVLMRKSALKEALKGTKGRRH